MRQAIAICSTALTLQLAAAPAVADIDEITVTATKREKSIQDVPITIQAFSSSLLLARQADSIDDIVRLAANMSFNAANEVNKGLTIRGVGTNNFHGNVNRAVGVYSDDVALSTPYSGTLGIYDLQRVELLRGPQNTLFGRNTIGGALNLISRTPDVSDGLNGYAVATLGEDKQQDLEGAVGFALSSRLAARLSAQTVNRDGLFVNQAPGREGEQLGERERHSYRAQLGWSISDATTLLASVSGGYNRGSNIGNKAVGLRDPADPSMSCSDALIVTGIGHESRTPCVADNGFNPSSDDWRTVYNTGSARADIDVEMAALRLDHAFESGIQLVALAAAVDTRVQQQDDVGGHDVQRLTPSQDSRFEQRSLDLRLVSPDSNGLTWLAGLYVLDEDTLQGTNVRNGSAGAYASNILDQNDRDESLYAKAGFPLAEKWRAELGLRHTRERKIGYRSVFRVVPLAPNGLLDPAQFVDNDQIWNAAVVARELVFENLRQDLEETGGEFSIEYRPGNEFLGYLRYSRGFKAGGFDTRALVALQGGDPTMPVGEEQLDAWELGIKASALDSRLRLSGAVFYYDWQDLQIFANVNNMPAFTNVPASKIFGLEAEAELIYDAWTANVSVGLLDTEITDIGNLGNNASLGHPLPNSPEFSLATSLTRAFEGRYGRVIARVDVSYAGESLDTLRDDQDWYSTKDAVTLVDTQLEWSPPGRNLRLALWGQNLTEERTCYDIGTIANPMAPAPNDLTTTAFCTPSDGQRRFGVRAQLSFGGP